MRFGRELTIRAPYGSPRDAYLAVAAFSHASVNCFWQWRTRGRRVAAVNLRAGLRLEPIFDFVAGSKAACLGAIVGLSLIFVPRVTLGNAENYRMRLYNFPILLSFLFTSAAPCGPW
jgi:hypothetical protein